MNPTSTAQDRFSWSVPHDALTADTVQQVAKPGRKFLIESVRYHNATGLAADAVNFFHIQVLIDAVEAADWSTETGQEGTITADTWLDFTKAAAASRTGAKDAEVSINFDETATASLPAGTLFIEGIYL